MLSFLEPWDAACDHWRGGKLICGLWFAEDRRCVGHALKLKLTGPPPHSSVFAFMEKTSSRLEDKLLNAEEFFGQLAKAVWASGLAMRMSDRWPMANRNIAGDHLPFQMSAAVLSSFQI